VAGKNPRAGCVVIGANTSYELTEIGLMHVLELSTLGSSVTEIASYLRITPTWLRKSLDEEDEEHFRPNVAEAFHAGQGEFKKRIRIAQANLGDVNPQMAIHLGKHHLGQTDKQEIEVTKTVHIVGTLPDYAQTPEQWRKQFAPEAVPLKVEKPRRQPMVIDITPEDVNEAG